MLSESDSLTLKPLRSGSLASAVGAEAFNPFELAMLMDCFKILAGRGPARSCEGEGLRGACEGDVSSEEELSRPSKSSSPDGGACEGPAGARACEGEGEGGACEGPARARACEGEGEGEGAAGESESQSTTSFFLSNFVNLAQIHLFNEGVDSVEAARRWRFSNCPKMSSH